MHEMDEHLSMSMIVHSVWVDMIGLLYNIITDSKLPRAFATITFICAHASFGN